ncbi:MAG: hypothetical protein ACI94L_001515, partial [Flavobacteriaceae bacterium]
AEIIKNGLVVIGRDISGTQIVENNEPLI